MIGAVGVCSWSLRPESPGQLVEHVRSCGLGRVQLALEPIRSGAWSLSRTGSELADAAIEIVSGMFEPEGEDYSSLDSIRETGGLRPDGTWEANRARAEACAEIASELGIELVTFHAGFIPHDSDDPERGIMIDRLRTVADIFADRGVRLGLETGQENAETLAELLSELRRESVGVNFDPANMILYGMGDPIRAVETLGSSIAQVHLKDAVPADRAGVWGTEVPVGTGSVDWDAFGGLVNALPSVVPALFEREAGENRIGDVCSGIAALSVLDPFSEAFDG